MVFPRSVIFEACEFLGRTIEYHAEFQTMVLRWELDQLEVGEGTIRQRCQHLFRFARTNPEARHDGQLVTDLIVEEAVRRVSPFLPDETFVRSLQRAGYVIE